MPERLTPDAFVARLAPGERLYLGGCGAEPGPVIDAMARKPDRIAGSTLTGVFIPGVNRRDLAALAPDVRIETFFVTPALRAGFARGQVRHCPLHYSGIDRRFRAGGIDRAVFRVSVPQEGRVSLGTAHDFAPAVMAGGARLYGVIDGSSPFVPDGETIAIDRFEALIEADSAPVLVAEEVANAVSDAIGGHVAAHIRDGDIVQAGIGAAPAGVLRALHSHSRLMLHGGALTDGMVRLLDAGAVSQITAGAMLGNAPLLERIGREDRIAFRSVAVTHDGARIASLPRFMAVNGAIEVDLFGQVNGETIGGQQISGHGGMADFARGARASKGGRSFTVLASTNAKGDRSRIVTRLDAGTPVAITRADVDVVATEYGVAEIADCDLDTRAERLIAIAAPAFRDQLMNEWEAWRRSL